MISEGDAEKRQYGVTDVNSPTGSDVELGEQHDLRRSLRPRHLQMIAIGGVIGERLTTTRGSSAQWTDTTNAGTGLFLGTANDLRNGGPAGLLMSYCIMASLLYAVMVRLSEYRAIPQSLLT